MVTSPVGHVLITEIKGLNDTICDTIGSDTVKTRYDFEKIMIMLESHEHNDQRDNI